MLRTRLILFTALAVGLTLAANPSAALQTATSPTVEQFLGAASPVEVVAAAKTDRVAWVAYDEGRRNLYTAVAPEFTPCQEKST